MINAKEANAMANAIAQKQIDKWTRKINKRILNAIKYGYYDIDLYYHYIPNCICDDLINYYKKLEYEITLNVDDGILCKYGEEYKLSIAWKSKRGNNE